jgi:hypothetical protein
MSRQNPTKPITEDEWLLVQNNAKTRALAAIESGDDQRLTALERAYYVKFLNLASPPGHLKTNA